MQKEATNRKQYIRAAVVFALCMASVFLWPYIGLLLRADLLFFAPQIVFPYDSFFVPGEFNSREVFSRSGALALTIIQWTVVGVAYVWFARRWSVGRAIITAIATIAVVGFITVAVFALFGVSLALDGP